MKDNYGSSVTITRDGAAAIVRFDRGRNRNAIDQDTILALTEVARDLSGALDIHLVILTGAKDIFSAGIDLKDPAKWQETDTSLLARREVAQRGAKLCRMWQDLPQLTVAAVNGPAVGGSVALALACDWRIMDRSSFLYLPETKVGLNMGWGAIPRIVSLVGAPQAKKLILLAEKLSPEAALSLGLIEEIAETGQATDVARALLSRAEVSPPALLRMSKEAINACATPLHHMGIYMDADQAIVCRDSAEGQEARERFLTR